MNNATLLLSILDEESSTIIKCALKMEHDNVVDDIIRCPLEHREILHGLLPDHISQRGPIIGAEEISDMIDLSPKNTVSQ